jgi:plastocyanin
VKTVRRSLLLLMLVTAVAGFASSGAGAAAGDASVTISSTCTDGQPFCFTPATVTITTGATVTWSNESGETHTVTRCDPAACNGESGGNGTDATFTSGTVPDPTGSFSHRFTAPGTYNYYCAVHGFPTMHGTVIVTAAPTTTAASTTTTAPAVPGVATSSTTTGVAVAATPATPTAQLAHTGGTPSLPAGIAIALVGSGLAFVAASRRKIARSPRSH